MLSVWSENIERLLKVCYTYAMKQETLKELGKFILDLTKIVIAIVVITPFVKGGDIEILPILSAVAMAVIGLYITNEGAKDE